MVRTLACIVPLFFVEGIEETRIYDLMHADIESFVTRIDGAQSLLAREDTHAGAAALIGYAARKSLLQYTVGLDTCLAYVSAARRASGTSDDGRLVWKVDVLQNMRAEYVGRVTETLRGESAMAPQSRNPELNHPIDESLETPNRVCRTLSRYPTDAV